MCNVIETEASQASLNFVHFEILRFQANWVNEVKTNNEDHC